MQFGKSIRSIEKLDCWHKVESKTDDLIIKISDLDKNISLTTQLMTTTIKSFEIHMSEFKIHKEKNEKEVHNIFNALRNISCPETGAMRSIEKHEREQNGKIDSLQKEVEGAKQEVAKTREAVRIWCYVFSGLISPLVIGFVLYIVKEILK